MTIIKRVFVTLSLLSFLLVNAEEPQTFFGCLSKRSIITCASRFINQEVDKIQIVVSGRRSDVPVSKVIEETSYLFAEGFQTIFGPERKEDDEEMETDRGIEGKNKLMLHKKKKQLRKLFLIGMILKTKIGLLFQLLSAHFQVKFFIVAVLGLIINAARFWLELKKAFHPAKVVYYEHAQHQHHYDHDDDHGYWGRSLNEDEAHKLAYAAHFPKN